jgi:hypothetical protein
MASWDDQEPSTETAVMSALNKTSSSKAMMMPKADHEPNLNPPILIILL